MAENNSFHTFLEKIRKDFDCDSEERKLKIQRAVKIQKRKFLCAIGKAEPSPAEDEDNFFYQQWHDTIATKTVKEILNKHQNFDMELYLACSKAIFLTYSGKIGMTLELFDALTYVITHARSFGDPIKNVFQLEVGEPFKIQFNDLTSPLSDSIYMRKISSLIEDLKTTYDEIKYMTLNTNVTYLTLLILRRFIKNETQFLDAFKRINTHDDYVILCPYPLHNQLPRIDARFNKGITERHMISAAYLAIHAFLSGTDAATKRVLRATCVQYMEWTGLQLPKLFFQVVNLYGIEEEELWDNLLLEGTYKSLFKLADNYYGQYKMSKTDPLKTVAWFPYCRALRGSYHKDLSASDNTIVCMILAYLVDLKLGFNNSFVRKSHFFKNNSSELWLNVAKKLHIKFNKPSVSAKQSRCCVDSQKAGTSRERAFDA